MTRAQRRVHAIAFPLLALVLLAALAYAFVRREVVRGVEAAPLGRVAP